MSNILIDRTVEALIDGRITHQDAFTIGQLLQLKEAEAPQTTQTNAVTTGLYGYTPPEQMHSPAPDHLATFDPDKFEEEQRQLDIKAQERRAELQKQIDGLPDAYFTPVNELNLSNRASNALKADWNITFFGDLLRHCDADRCYILNIGARGYNEINCELKRFGLDLCMDPPEDWFYLRQVYLETHTPK